MKAYLVTYELGVYVSAESEGAAAEKAESVLFCVRERIFGRLDTVEVDPSDFPEIFDRD